MSGPYDYRRGEPAFKIRQEFALPFPRGSFAMLRVDQGVDFARPLFVRRDPARRWARSWRGFVRQLRDIMLDAFWTEAGMPERSPANVRVDKVDVGAGRERRA